MKRIEGHKNATRAEEAKAGRLIFTEDDGKGLSRPFGPYRKTSLTYAVQMSEPFEVDTLEGVHTGKARDWLAVGAHGEMYPIDDAVFRSTYEAVRPRRLAE